MAMANISISIPTQVIYLRERYGVNMFEIMKLYSTWKDETGKESWIGFEIDMVSGYFYTRRYFN